MNSRKTKAPAIDIGVSGGERTRIVKGLSSVLADSYTGVDAKTPRSA